MNFGKGDKSKQNRKTVVSIEDIKRIALKAMFSVDNLMNRIVFKGGNAIALIYKIEGRASLDLDFSISDEFNESSIESISAHIKESLDSMFSEKGLVVFDYRFAKRPKNDRTNKPEFWGGYNIEFKIIDTETYNQPAINLSRLQREAFVIGFSQEKIFKIEISKYEYCDLKEERDLEGLTIFVYSPEMIVFEKLRAICQQIKEYSLITGSNTSSARARDFYDIYALTEEFKVDIDTEKNITLMKTIFSAKQVPLAYLNKVEEYREFHRPDFVSVINTISQGIDLKDFDFYFDYVINKYCTKSFN